MGNFWSDKVPHHEKDKATPESKRKDYEFWQRQQNMRSGKVNLHPEIKPSHQPLNIVKHNPNESREAKRKRIQEARSATLKKILEESKHK